MTDYQRSVAVERAELAASSDPLLDEPLRVEGMSPLILESLTSAGFDTRRKLLATTPQELAKIPEISLEMADRILEQVSNLKA